MLAHSTLCVFAVRVLASGILLLPTAVREASAQDDPNGSVAEQLPPPVAPQLPAGLVTEPKVIVSAIDYATEKFGDGTGPAKSGFYPELSNMITGSGWISAGPGYRHYYSDGRLFVDGSAAVSWHFYKMVQGRVEAPELANGHLAVGVQDMWQDLTQVDYFGIGPGTIEANRSQYRMQVNDLVGYAKLTTTYWLSFTGEFGWLDQPKIQSPGGSFQQNLPDVRDAFPADPAVSLASQPTLTHAQAAVTVDTRDHRGHPTSGFLYRAAFTNYTDESTGAFSFRQYEAEALNYIPIGDRWVLAVHGWSVHCDVPGGHQVPFYLLPALGGNNTLRDYLDFQFHDTNTLVVNGEARVAMMAHVDAAVFFDAGNVASRFSDLNLDKTSYGAGLRLHTQTTTLARLDVADGAAGWRVVFRTSEPFRLSRVRRQIAAIPFLP